MWLSAVGSENVGARSPALSVLVRSVKSSSPFPALGPGLGWTVRSHRILGGIFMGWVALFFAVVAVGFLALRVAGQWAPSPMPIWLERVFLGNPLRRLMFSPRLALDLLGSIDGLRVGEVGVGIGVVTTALAEGVGTQGVVLGVDRQPDAVIMARTHLIDRGLRQAVIVRADARQLPWETGSMDGVVMVAVLGEIPAPDRLQVLREVRRVLKPACPLVVVEYWPDPHFIPLRRLLRLFCSGGFAPDRQLTGWLQYGVRAVASGQNDVQQSR